MDLASLSVSVAINVITANSDDLERELIKKTAAAARVRNIDRIRDRVDKKDLSIVTYDSWAEPHGFLVEGEESRQVLVAAAIRTGIALSTENLDTLLEMANNEREFSAGPISALRIIGHPSLKPLNKKPTDEQVEKARILLDRHHGHDPGSQDYPKMSLKSDIHGIVSIFRPLVSVFDTGV